MDPSTDSFGIIAGRNPVLEALQSDRAVEAVYLLPDQQGGSVEKIRGLAKARKIPLKEVSRRRLEEMAGITAHQGVAARLQRKKTVSLEALFDLADARGEPPFFLLADRIEDPHNLGAIIRTAEGCGVHGLLLPTRRSAPLSATVEKTAAGALSHLPIATVGNVAAAMEALKKRGVWLYGAEADGADYGTLDYDGGVCLVVGSEGFGLSRLTREHCDFLVSIPMYGNINSLNASVAAGVLLCDIARKRKTR